MMIFSLLLLAPALAVAHPYNIASCYLVKEGRVWYVGFSGGGTREIPAGEDHQVGSSTDSKGGACASVVGKSESGKVIGNLVSVIGEQLQWSRPCRYAGQVRSEAKLQREIGFGEFLTLPFEGSGDSARLALYLASPEEKAVGPGWFDTACKKAAKSLNAFP